MAQQNKQEISGDTLIDLSFLGKAKMIERDPGSLLKQDGVYAVRITKAVPKGDGLLLTLKTTDKEEPDMTLYKRLRLTGDVPEGKESAASGLEGVLFALGYNEAEIQAKQTERPSVNTIASWLTSEPRNVTHVEVTAKAIKGSIQSDVGYFQTPSDLAAKKKSGRGLRSSYDLKALEAAASAQRMNADKIRQAKQESGGGAPGLPGARGVSSPPPGNEADVDV